MFEKLEFFDTFFSTPLHREHYAHVNALLETLVGYGLHHPLDRLVKTEELAQTNYRRARYNRLQTRYASDVESEELTLTASRPLSNGECGELELVYQKPGVRSLKLGLGYFAYISLELRENLEAEYSKQSYIDLGGRLADHPDPRTRREPWSITRNEFPHTSPGLSRMFKELGEFPDHEFWCHLGEVDLPSCSLEQARDITRRVVRYYLDGT